MQKGHVVGLSLAIVKDGRIVKASGYGLANVETGTPATPETVYKIASISKEFLAAGIMLLQQDGKLHLDDKVDLYIAGTPDAWKEITIRQVLTHTAGLPLDPPDFEPFKETPDSAVVSSLFSYPLLYKPGEDFRYSNTDYFVIAEIIRKVSGMPWEQFLAQRIFTFLHMSATRTTTTTTLVPNRASGYVLKDGALQNAPDWIALRPSGAFLSTVLDMAKWDADLYKDDLLTASSREQMWQPVKLKNGTVIPYGCGWGLSPWQGRRRVFHDGGLPGFSTDFERFIDDRLTVVVLSNTQSADASRIALAVAGFYLPAAAPANITHP
jgi:CubicO group peptidase (beta-lactamase class C family)